MEIRDLQQAEKGLRSGMAQEQVLGIRLFDIYALCDAWHLAVPILVALSSYAHAGHGGHGGRALAY